MQRAPADGVRVLVLRERLRTPGQRARGLDRTPGRIAKACIPEGSIVGKGRMIARSVKADVAYGNSTTQGHPEELNRAIQVHIIDGILVVPDAGGWIRYLISNEPTAIGSQQNAFERVDARSSPGVEGRRHLHRGSHLRKDEE